MEGALRKDVSPSNPLKICPTSTSLYEKMYKGSDEIPVGEYIVSILSGV